MKTPITNEKIARLEKIGFVPVGKWKLDQQTITLECEDHQNATNVLYAFVVDHVPVYIGKTVQQLCKRMHGYRSPGSTQPTNIRNKKSIIDKLTQGRDVQLFVLPDNGLMYYGGFHINLAAGLEDDLIRQLKPEWNGGQKEVRDSFIPVDESD